MRQKTVPCGQIDDAAAPEPAADPPRHLPGFVELFPRQAARMTRDARHTVEQTIAGESLESRSVSLPFEEMENAAAPLYLWRGWSLCVWAGDYGDDRVRRGQGNLPCCDRW